MGELADALNSLTGKYEALLSEKAEKLRRVHKAVFRSDSDYRQAKRHMARARRSFLASEQAEHWQLAVEHLMRSKIRTARRTAKAMGIDIKQKGQA
jgi:hypothetical protein